MRLPLMPVELLVDPKLNWYERQPHLTSSSKIEDGKDAGSNPMMRLASVNRAIKRARSLEHSNVVIRVPGSLEVLLKMLEVEKKALAGTSSELRS